MNLSKHITLKEKEKIITIVRRFVPTLFLQVCIISTLIVTPFFFLFWLFARGGVGLFIFMASVLIGLFVFLHTLFLWRRNVFIVTTHRIIDLEQQGFFNQVVSAIAYDRIEDVGARITGFWGTVLRYGSISVQTGGGKVRVVVRWIHQPLRLQHEINEHRELYVSRQTHMDDDDAVAVIQERLDELTSQQLAHLGGIVLDKLKKPIKKSRHKGRTTKNKRS